MYTIKLYFFLNVLNTILFVKYGDWIPLANFFFYNLDYYNILISMWLHNQPLLFE